jgi:O-antigen/teichoic acid export membrane protein
MRLRIFAMLLLLLPGIARTAFASPAEAPFSLYYQGSETLVRHRLELDPSTHPVDTLPNAQAAVYQDQLPPPGPELDALKARVTDGMGLVVILGADLDAASLKALTGGAVEQTGVVEAPEGPAHAMAAEKFAAIIGYVGPSNDPLATNISWKSAVRIQERSLLKVSPGATVMVETTTADPIRPATPILIRVAVGKGAIFILNVWIKEGDLVAREQSYLRMLQGAHDAQNYDFQRFFFFNWILYAMTRESVGITPVRYGRWIAAPVPSPLATAILVSIFTAALAAIVIGLIWARRYSMRHPEEVEHFYRQGVMAPKPVSLGAAAMPQETPQMAVAHGDPRWEVVGFHRPLSGFIYNYLQNIFLIIPFNFVVTFWIDRNFINPFLEARGAGQAVGQVMLFLLPLLDLGTSQAMVKYYAEYRVREPGRAMMYMQFFVWFHLLLGIISLGALGLLGAIGLPGTVFAYMSWFVVLNALAWFPPFFPIFAALFRGQQRFDYVQLEVVLFYVMNPALQMIGSIIGRHWGLMHPAYGEGMGVVIGFGFGFIAGNLLLGLISCVFYGAMGMRLLTVLLAHFDRDAMKKSIVFGAKLTAGTVMPFFTWGTVPVIMAALLPNFLELNEIWILVFGLSFAYLETGASIFASLMPSMSESYSQKMLMLTQRYIDQGFRWGLMATTMLGGAYIVFSAPLIEGLLPPQFSRAVGVLILVHIYRLFDFFTREPDQVFQAVGRSGTFTWAAVVEHGSRIVMTWFFIKWWGFPGLFWAFAGSSALKVLFVWPVMARYIIKPVLSGWQTFVNPIAAGLANYFILRAIVGAMWQGRGHTANTWLVIMIALVGSLPLYMFISAILGWDDGELREFKDAIDLVPAPFRIFGQLTYAVVNLGTSISPLHNRFPSKLDAEASREAAQLTAAKVEMR